MAEVQPKFQKYTPLRKILVRIVIRKVHWFGDKSLYSMTNIHRFNECGIDFNACEANKRSKPAPYQFRPDETKTGGNANNIENLAPKKVNLNTVTEHFICICLTFTMKQAYNSIKIHRYINTVLKSQNGGENSLKIHVKKYRRNRRTIADKLYLTCEKFTCGKGLPSRRFRGLRSRSPVAAPVRICRINTFRCLVRTGVSGAQRLDLLFGWENAIWKGHRLNANRSRRSGSTNLTQLNTKQFYQRLHECNRVLTYACGPSTVYRAKYISGRWQLDVIRFVTTRLTGVRGERVYWTARISSLIRRPY